MRIAWLNHKLSWITTDPSWSIETSVFLNDWYKKKMKPILDSWLNLKLISTIFKIAWSALVFLFIYLCDCCCYLNTEIHTYFLFDFVLTFFDSQFDLLHQCSTPSVDTGPSSAKTESRYLYVETSSPVPNEAKFQFESPYLSGNPMMLT